MSPPLSRSSFDNPLSKPTTTTRLQHSPSLPNIWFPPHSRPLPNNMSSATRPTPAHSSDPSPATLSVPLSQPPQNTPQNSQSDSRRDEMEKFPSKGSDSRRSTIKTISYTRQRQRKDRDVSQHLLTPPLTPSSSIRTTASADSVERKLDDDKVQILQQLQEPEATRFLYVENISRSVTSTALQSSIADALAHISNRRDFTDETTPAGQAKAGVRDTNASCIKGFFLKHTNTTGTLFLAFHDVRDAVTARLVLSQRADDGVLTECLGEEKLIDGMRAWFPCRFITAEELVKTIGNSNFLATTDGGFLLSVALVDSNNLDDSHTLESGKAKKEVDVSLLVKLLEAYGSLRLLKPDSPTDDGQTFHVEFFDVRDATEAYASLNDQIMFGMKLSTSGRVPPDPLENNSALEIPYNKSGQERPDTPLSGHQPSASESHIPKLRPAIGPAGEASQMRNRFTSEATRSRPRAASFGDETASSASPPRPSDRQPKAPSPPIFYTTFDFTDTYSTTSSRISDEKISNGRTAEQKTYPSAEGTISTKQWEPQQTCSIVECRYCPSRGHDPTRIVQPPFSNHINPPPFVNPGSFPVQTPPPHVFSAPPEFDAQGIYPSPGWPFDPNLMMAPPGGNIVDIFAPAFIPALPVAPIEHRFPDHHQNPNHPNFIPNGLVFPTISPMLHVPPPAAPFVEPQQQPGVVSLDNHHHIFVNNAAAESSASTADVDANGNLKLHTSTTNSPGISDRNFLNIPRIEEGLDTRTTVMIKNIPNKMTARDLIQYINEVCPRRIDFLYLRMDFKNGCNVGYAFVNFIRVQDMLNFAQNRLGIKWNLFSSEKVLQMSYANYQGKEALVEKFKNSCIMDEREEWRPKIFYSSGPEQGLPEPFPAPTHLRRKERSSHNRGALYVPGAGSGGGGSAAAGSGYLNNGPLRRQELFPASGSGSNPGSTKYLEHRTRGVDRDRCVDDVHAHTGGGGRRGKVQFDRSR